MDGRTAGLLMTALLLGCGGCVTTRDDVLPMPVTPPPGAKVTKAAGQDVKKKGNEAGVALEFAKLRRDQAAAAKDDPEAQTRLRDSARTAYQEALKVDPNNLAAHRGLAQVYVQLGDYERAFDAYRKALAKHPKSADLWVEVAMAHNRRKDWAEAQRCCRMAVELDPEHRQAQAILGLTLARAGQYDQAVSHLTRAKGAAVAHYDVARMQLHNGQTDQARQHLSIALRENPNLPAAQDLLASLDAGPQGDIVQTRGIATLQPPTP